MYDQRDNTRIRKQPARGWIQDLIKDSNNSQERTVGRDISESIPEKSTSTASTAITKKTSANNAADMTDGKAKEDTTMNEMQELGKLINKTVEASLLKIQKQIEDLQNGYIRRNNTLLEDNTALKAKIMYLEAEKVRYDAAQTQLKKYRSIINWTFGGIATAIIILLLMRICGWI